MTIRVCTPYSTLSETPTTAKGGQGELVLCVHLQDKYSSADRRIWKGLDMDSPRTLRPRNPCPSLEPSSRQQDMRLHHTEQACVVSVLVWVVRVVAWCGCAASHCPIADHPPTF